MHPKDALEKHFRLIKQQKAALKKLRIETVSDLLYHFPTRYGVAMPQKNINELKKGDEVVVSGKLLKLEKTRGWKKRISMTRATLEDQSGKLRIVWFNQPYLAKMMQEGAIVTLKGKVGEDKNGLYLANPTTDTTNILPGVKGGLLGGEGESGTLQASYSESRGISSRWFYYALKKVFAANVHKKIEEYLPEAILKKYHLPSLSTALVWMHQPKTMGNAEAARKRFSFEEVFFIQLSRQKARQEYQTHETFPVEVADEAISGFAERFPFELTHSQQDAIHAILDDFCKGKPMTRLLEGDVGSGKTAVAAVTAHAVVTSRPRGQDFGNLQAAIMAPTEILARQHFESFIQLFSHLPIQIGLITGSECRKFPSKVSASWQNGNGSTPISRTQLLKWVANGEIPIVVGTHALIQKHVKFKDLAFVVIDEQHRFGTMQRFELVRKDKRVPHLLSMTATPIPRTLALTIYGDLDLTLIAEMPRGRKPIMTEIVEPKERARAYEKALEELRAGRQVYVICPRIDEPDPEKEGALMVKSVKEEAARLKKEVFPEYEIAILHSKMKPKERESVMQKFLKKEVNILVATSVIEVGVNVPNATVIIIEGAERFGLSQLHQLRGRVLRSTHQAYCFVFPDTKVAGLARLRALRDAKNGFELAELDLRLRGAGELSGKKQWGISDIGMEAIQNLKMVEAARAEAAILLEKDSGLVKYPLLRERMTTEETHWE
ncbi:MAG: ATP-dependent DNA helicase RecG [Parcubacteria group bacterium]|nr:ATP-dependent DNA helicase RecG [Parcubacteria group bacterium]